MKSIVTETDLLQFSLCPLRLAGSDTAYPKYEFGARMNTAIANLTLAAFNGTPRTLRQIHKQLDTVRELSPYGAPQDISSPTYRNKVKIAEVLQWLFKTHKVLRPVMRYRLRVGRWHVDGEYALLQQGKYAPSILRLRHRACEGVPEIEGPSLPPDIISYLRYAHAISEGEYPDVQVFNLLLPQGRYWVNRFRYSVCSAAVTRIVENFMNRDAYPSPGPYCASCTSRACIQGHL